MGYLFTVTLITLPTVLWSLDSLPTPATPSPPRCVKRLTHNIQRYWAHSPPADNISYPEINWHLYIPSDLKFIAGTKSAENSPYKCRLLRFYAERVKNGIAALMQFDNDDASVSVKVRERNGYLILVDYVIIYNVIALNGVYAAYKCLAGGDDISGIEGEEDRPPEAFVAAVDKASIEDIKNAMGVMELIGFKLDHKFDCPV